jgi:heme exporter protein B
MMLALRQTLAVARKDFRSELRTRYALNALAMFVVVVVAVMSFAAGGEQLSAEISAGLMWIAMFFTGVTGLGRSFVSEEERGTFLLLRLTVPSTPVYFGKLLVNLVLALLANSLIALLFMLLMTGALVKSPVAFLVVVILSSFGFASALTIIAAIISRSSSKGTLYPVISFPVVLPLIILGVDLLRRSIQGIGLEKLLDNMLMLGIYTAVLVIVSYILFDLLWKE